MLSLSVCRHGNLCLYSLHSQKWGMQKNHPPSRLLLWPFKSTRSHAKAPSQTEFFSLLLRPAGSRRIHPERKSSWNLPSPLHGWCSSPLSSLPPSANATSCFLLQGMMGAGPSPPPLSVQQAGVKLARRAGWRQREGGRDRWDWMMVAIATELVLGERLKPVNANTFNSMITFYYYILLKLSSGRDPVERTQLRERLRNKSIYISRSGFFYEDILLQLSLYMLDMSVGFIVTCSVWLRHQAPVTFWPWLWINADFTIERWSTTI